MTSRTLLLLLENKIRSFNKSISCDFTSWKFTVKSQLTQGFTCLIAGIPLCLSQCLEVKRISLAQQLTDLRSLNGDD